MYETIDSTKVGLLRTAEDSRASIAFALPKPVVQGVRFTVMLRIVFLALICSIPFPSAAQDGAATGAQLSDQAQAAFQARRFKESASLYSRALPLVQDVDRAGIEYSLACSLARAGDSASAFQALARSVDDGYTDREDAQADEDLASLRGDPRWPPTLARMSAAKAEQDARWGDAAFATPNETNIPDADKLAGLGELWAQAKYGFANFWHVPRLDWDKAYRDCISKVLATHSTGEYYRVLESFYALLEDGHTGVYPPEALEGKLGRLPIQTRLVEGRLVVVGFHDLGNDLAAVHIGDEIVRINSEAALAWAERNVAGFVSASTPQDRDSRTYGSNLFLAPIGTRFDLVFQAPSGRQTARSFEVMKGGSQGASPFEMKLLPGGVTYVALNGFDDDTAAKEWDKHWSDIGKSKSLILDLRENGGGNSSVGDHILSTLIDRTEPGELSRSTRWIATRRAWGYAETPLSFPVGTVTPDPERHFGGPVVLLIGPRTYSAGEDMVVVFAQAHRGQTMGEPTGGSTGQPLIFRLPGGGLARVCTKHDSFADGREFVGVGIQPDILLRTSRAEIIAGRDSVLESAVQLLQTKP